MTKVIGRAIYESTLNVSAKYEKANGYPNALIVMSNVSDAIKKCDNMNSLDYKRRYR